jgi:hypothetical protein
MTEKNWYFSIFGGYLYEVSSEEESVIDAFQIPLRKRPDSSCKKCHGRFYTSYNKTQQHFNLCPKCSKKCIDAEKIIQKRNAKKSK